MKSVKRIEIIAGSLVISRIVKALESAGINRYFVVPGITGKGRHFERQGDELTGVFSLDAVLITGNEETVKLMSESISALIEKFGGLILVSDGVILAGDEFLL